MLEVLFDVFFFRWSSSFSKVRLFERLFMMKKQRLWVENLETFKSFILLLEGLFLFCWDFVDWWNRVEQDPLQFVEECKMTLRKVVDESKIPLSQIKCLGIANQRGSFLTWNKQTGKPVHNIITWQDVRIFHWNL